MKREILLIVGLLTLLVTMPLVSACTQPAPAPKSEPIVIDVVGLNDDPTIMLYKQFWDLAERVEQKSGGAIKFNFKGGPSVITWFEQFDALSTGVLPALWSGSNVAESIVPEVLAQGVTHGTMRELRANGFHDLLNESFKEHNMIYLMSGDSSGFDQFLRVYLDVKIDGPEDLAGLKFASTPNTNPMFEHFGAVPVGVDVFDMYTAVERGMVSGTTCTADDTVFRFSFNEVCKYFITPGFGSSDIGFFMNLDSWNKIPPDQQKLINDTILEVEKDWESEWTEVHEGWVTKWTTEGGMEEIAFSKDNAKRFIAAFEAATWDPLIAKSPVRGPKLRDLANAK
ncbi:TRAP transporter substrate-binding protein DctP [Chloroflexota bacterium]